MWSLVELRYHVLEYQAKSYQGRFFIWTLYPHFQINLESYLNIVSHYVRTFCITKWYEKQLGLIFSA